MPKILSVAAIEKGTVIDHIPAGQALRILRLLKLMSSKYKITLGLNLPSKSLSRKDLIKIENKILTDIEANDVIIFAPQATINLIEAFEVTQKIKTHFPEIISQVFVCPNPTCITHTEPVISSFHTEERSKMVKLTCHYCEKQFDRDQVREATL